MLLPSTSLSHHAKRDLMSASNDDNSHALFLLFVPFLLFESSIESPFLLFYYFFKVIHEKENLAHAPAHLFLKIIR